MPHQIDIEAVLGQPAIYQILNRLKDKNEDDKKTLALQIESACKRFDHKRKGKLSVDEYYNVIKVQQKVDITKDEIRRLVADLHMDKEYKISIQDFMTVPIISEAVFQAMDKNKDGYVSKGELKLAQRGISMKELGSIIDEVDTDGDGRLTFEEIKMISEKVHAKNKSKTSKKSSAASAASQASKKSSTSKKK